MGLVSSVTSTVVGIDQSKIPHHETGREKFSSKKQMHIKPKITMTLMDVIWDPVPVGNGQ